MSQLETILTVFAAVLTLAVLMQAIALVGIYLSVKTISRKFDAMSEEIKKQVKSISAKADEVFASAKAVTEATKSVRENLTSTSDLVHKRVAELDKIVGERVADVDSFLQESTDLARNQLSHLQDVIDRSSQRIDETFDMVHKGILGPLSELNAIVTGLRVGLDVLFRRKRPSTRIHQDEEMFI